MENPEQIAYVALRRALEYADQESHRSFKRGVESGRRQILSCLSPGLQAEVLGSIDLATMATMKAMKEMAEGKIVYLTCKRCGTEVEVSLGMGCPVCDQSE